MALSRFLPSENRIVCRAGSFQAPWCSLGECGEQYCLVWESRYLRDLGSAMTSLLDGLVSMVAQEALKYTVLSGGSADLSLVLNTDVSGLILSVLSVRCPRHRGGSDVAGVSAGGGQRHRQPLVRLSDPLGRGGQTPGAGSEEQTAGIALEVTYIQLEHYPLFIVGFRIVQLCFLCV